MTDSTRLNLARKSLGSLAIKVATVGLAFVAQLLLARYMGADHYGIYVYALTWLNVLVLVARLGSDGLLTRFAAAYAVEQRWDALKGLIRFGYGAVGAACLVLGILAWLALTILRPELGPDRYETFILALGLLPISALWGVGQSLLFGLKHPWRAQLPEPVSRVLMIVAAAAMYWSAGSLSSAQAMVLGIASTLFALLMGSIGLIRILPRPMAAVRAAAAAGEWCRVALPLLLMSGLRLLLTQSDILLVGWLLGDTRAAGIYAVATRLAELTTFGLQAVNMSLAPMISELHTTRQNARLQAMVTRSARGVFAFTAVVSLLLGLMGTRILGLFGPDFIAAYPALLILLIGQTINAATGSVGYLMTMTGHQRQAAWLVALAAAVTLGLAFSLIPQFGIRGAAMASAAGLTLLNLSMLVFVAQRLKINSTVFRRLSYGAA